MNDLRIEGTGPLENSTAIKWMGDSLDGGNIGEQLREGLNSSCPYTFRAACFLLYIVICCDDEGVFPLVEDVSLLINEVVDRLCGLVDRKEYFVTAWPDEQALIYDLHFQIGALIKARDAVIAGVPAPGPFCATGREMGLSEWFIQRIHFGWQDRSRHADD